MNCHPSPNTHVMAFVRPRVGTVPFGATADTCAETAECRLQCMCREVCAVRTANLHAVRSAITATAKLLVLDTYTVSQKRTPTLSIVTFKLVLLYNNVGLGV